MIDFACKTFSLDEIIRCSLGITRADFRVMEFLVRQDDDWFTTETLAKKLKLNLTTVQRAVKKLHGHDIVERKQNNLGNGGYVFIYRIRDKKQVRRTILDIIDSWKHNVEQALTTW